MLSVAKYEWQVGGVSRACESRDSSEPRESSSGSERWREIDRKLCSIAKRRSALDAEELALIREAIALAIWRNLGMTSIREYLEHRMGYSPSVASERVRVAEALEGLPKLEAALATGELPYSALREITRIATRKTESAWLAACRGKNLREIEDLLAEREPGDRPSSPRKPDLRMRDVRYKVRPATAANLRLARQALEAEMGERLDDDELLDALAQRVLAGHTAGGGAPADAAGASPPGASRARNRAATQVAITLCPQCQTARQSAAGASIALRPEEVDHALCDAEWIDVNGRTRANQDITPAVRRIVWHRDHDRCRVPTCRAANKIDVHHIIPRWQGGSHTPDNLLLLCSGHHKALHRGDLMIEGLAATAVITMLADSDPEIEEPNFHVESAGADFHVESTGTNSHVGNDEPFSRVGNDEPISHVGNDETNSHVGNDEPFSRVESDEPISHVGSARASAIRSDALLALRGLGFSKGEARRAVNGALDAALRDAPHAVGLESLIRAALRLCPKPTS